MSVRLAGWLIAVAVSNLLDPLRLLGSLTAVRGFHCSALSGRFSRLVTTTESIKRRPKTFCRLCGWEGVLLILNSNHELVHEAGECPEGVPSPLVDERPIAHDALSSEMGAYLPALEHLREIGVGLLGKGLTRTRDFGVEGVAVAPRVDLVRARKEMEMSSGTSIAFPVPRHMEEDAYVAGQARPIRAKPHKPE